MRPKGPFTREDVVKAAFAVARRQGADRLSARSIAKELKSSTMPIYSLFESMRSIEAEVVGKSFELLSTYQTTSRTGDIFLDMGVGYVLFAVKETRLFECITDEKNRKLRDSYHERNFRFLIQKLSDYPLVRRLSEKEIRRFFLQGWIYSHGLADLIASAFFGKMSEKEIIELLTYTGGRYIEGFKRLLRQRDQTRNRRG
jgi:AcrR family transcriptional regulator